MMWGAQINPIPDHTYTAAQDKVAMLGVIVSLSDLKK